MQWNDLRYTVRTLRKAPAFAAAAILTLALGIGANTAIFSVVNAVLLRPLPFSQPEQLVQIAERNDKLNLPLFSSSIANYLSWKEQNSSFQSMGAIGFASLNLTGRGDPVQLNGSTISPSLFPLLGLRPVVGRAFREGEDKPGSPPVVMIGEAVWRSRFSGDRSLVGQNVTFSGTSYTVVGIAPAALNVLTGGDVALPMILDPTRMPRLNHTVTTVGRLKPGVDLVQAQAEMDAVSRRLGQQYPEVKDWGIRLVSFFRTFVSPQLQTALLVLLGAVAVVLLIACANVANLLLSRAAARQREIAVRIALGATRNRLLQQLLTESVVLSALGGAAGIAAAVWAVRLIDTTLPAGVLPVQHITVDTRVLLFALGATLLTGLLFGMAPAWHAASTDLNSVLKQGGRLSTGVRPWLRNGLVAAELGLATVLLIGAGLLMQSLQRLQQVQLGFRPQNLMTFQLSLTAAKYRAPAASWGFYGNMLRSMKSVPGVREAALSSGIPFGGGNYTTTPMTPLGGSLLPPGASVPLDWRIVSPDYFRAMEVPLLRGRYFTEQDARGAPDTMIVSQETARRFWGPADPLGKVIQMVGSGRTFTVVGVVGNVRNTALSQEPGPATYMSAVAMQFPVMDVLLRTTGNPETVLTDARKMLRSLDAELPLSNPRTMEQWVSNNAAQPRLNSLLLGTFAGVALLIAAIGIYGVLSYSVTQRTREIGLRMAMGAQQGSVIRLVVREGMVVALAGIGAGLLIALAASRALASLLFGVAARDPLTFAAVTGVLSLVALAACYVPARRASLVDPIVALRDE